MSDQLRELASKATPGPWKALVHGTANQEQAALLALNSVLATRVEDNPDIKFTDMAWVDIEDGRHVALIGNGPVGPENAHYIAAANPTTILALLAERDSALTENRELRAALQKLRQTHYVNEADCWYSCPRARSDWRDGSANCDDSRSDDCDCGADEANAIIDAALALQDSDTGEAAP